MFKDPMINSLTNLLLINEKEAANRVYLRQPRNGIWTEYTWAEVVLQARKVAGFLLQSGLKRGSNISIISKNCAEWFITDFGITLAGMVNVPLFSNQREDSIQYVLKHADVKLVFVGKLDDHQRVRSYVPEQYQTVNFEYHNDISTTHTWGDVLRCEPLIDVIHPQPDDLYTIIYSSGTTGSPKGAMYTHQTIAHYLSLFPRDLRVISDEPFYKFISYLPLAHVYERTAIQLASVSVPSDVSFVESLDKFAENLREVRPTLFAAVPRIWGVFKQKIEQKLPPKKLNLLLKIPLLSGFIKKKIRKELGFDRCTTLVSGASALPLPVYEFFKKLGIIIQEGYGQTENMAYATFSQLHQVRLGYVGTARIDVELKVSEINELLVKSPCLMSGYYNNTEATKAAFTSDGWLRTGDVVEMDPQGRVKITSRTSEIFKNQTGEFVAPGPIEKRFAANNLVEQLCLVGSGLPTNVLMVSLIETSLINKKKEVIKKSLKETLGEVNSGLAKYEKISHVIVVKDPWTPNNDMLTPTLKVKRKVIEQHYSSLIQTALADHQSIIWE